MQYMGNAHELDVQEKKDNEPCLFKINQILQTGNSSSRFYFSTQCRMFQFFFLTKKLMYL